MDKREVISSVDLQHAFKPPSRGECWHICLTPSYDDEHDDLRDEFVSVEGSGWHV